MADVVNKDIADQANGRKRGAISCFTYPECGGALWELTQGKLVRFECHVGHGYSPQSLDEEKGQALEVALWTALRQLRNHYPELASIDLDDLIDRARRQRQILEAERCAAAQRSLTTDANI